MKIRPRSGFPGQVKIAANSCIRASPLSAYHTHDKGDIVTTESASPVAQAASIPESEIERRCDDFLHLACEVRTMTIARKTLDIDVKVPGKKQESTKVKDTI